MFEPFLLEMSRGAFFEMDAREWQEHSIKVSSLCRRFGLCLRVDNQNMDSLIFAGLMHDIGKVNIKSEILNKRGPLLKEEWIEIQNHPVYAHDLLLKDHPKVAKYVLHHHERWDGGGYPAKLKEEEIPFCSRILAIVDSYEAMTSNRPYRNAMTYLEAFEEINKNAGTQFDPELAEIFVKELSNEFSL